MLTENNKAKTIKLLRELLSKQTLLLRLMVFCAILSMEASAQTHFITVRKETNVFTSYVLLLSEKHSEKKDFTDSLKIFVPFQDIQMLDYSIVDEELFVVYESNGTNRITRGTTVTLLRYGLKRNNFTLHDSVMIFKGANPGIRNMDFSIDNHLVKLTKKNQVVKEYDMSSAQKYLNLAKDIIRDFSKTQ